MKLLDNQYKLFNETSHTIISQKEIFYTCNWCKKKVHKVYQQGVCRTCLTKEFQRFRKIIDSVRK